MIIYERHKKKKGMGLVKKKDEIVKKNNKDEISEIVKKEIDEIVSKINQLNIGKGFAYI